MSKYRVYELAKEFKTESKVVLNLLERNGHKVKNHMSSVGDEEREMLRNIFSGEAARQKAEQEKAAQAQKAEKAASAKAEKKPEKKSGEAAGRPSERARGGEHAAGRQSTGAYAGRAARFFRRCSSDRDRRADKPPRAGKSRRI